MSANGMFCSYIGLVALYVSAKAARQDNNVIKLSFPLRGI
jgi:hypothetical protein